MENFLDGLRKKLNRLNSSLLDCSKIIHVHTAMASLFKHFGHDHGMFGSLCVGHVLKLKCVSNFELLSNKSL